MTAGSDLVATFVFVAGFATTLVRFELFVAFLSRFGFFIASPVHGTREPYACLERSKMLIECVMCSAQFKISEVGIVRQWNRDCGA